MTDERNRKTTLGTQAGFGLLRLLREQSHIAVLALVGALAVVAMVIDVRDEKIELERIRNDTRACLLRNDLPTCTVICGSFGSRTKKDACGQTLLEASAAEVR
jgi:hypothetical protein